jgi:mannose-1-phosphate guanylyltransferase/mannose-1-phosphate guanylyltransferase/mannose-6-phosphate isomerase
MLIATLGVKDLVIVEAGDAVMVAHRDSIQKVGSFVAQLKKLGRREHDSHSRVYRPWGFYELIEIGERYQVKHLMVRPGASLSLQMHHHRAEHWIVVKGTARVTINDRVRLISENESTYIPIGAKHRLENPGMLPLSLIEVQSGSYLGEDDIIRFEDCYGRTPTGMVLSAP